MKNAMLIFCITAMLMMFAVVARGADYGILREGGWKYGNVYSLELAPGFSARTVKEVMGVYSDSREALAEYIRVSNRQNGVPDVVLAVVLKSAEGEEIRLDVVAVDDLPLHSVPVACGKIKAKKCWFIKYKDEEKGE